MGSGMSAEEKRRNERSRQIEIDMLFEQKAAATTLKLLLLGASACGKSTVLKQMKILHDNGFREEEYQKQKGVIYANIVKSMSAILRAMKALNIDYADKERKVDEVLVIETSGSTSDTEPLSVALQQAIIRLWADDGVRACFDRSSEYQLNDSAKYFLDDIDRICSPGYHPNEQDMLHVRVKTTGIVEVCFKMKNKKFRVFDVGGQRSERKKWIHCFDNVNAIIFVAAMSEYDQLLVEDNETNRIIESLKLFSTICNSDFFFATNIILFLNKKDLFEEKIRKIPITCAFPDYEGEQTAEECGEYIADQFRSVNSNPNRQIYDHQTCATDTNQIQLVLDASIDTIITGNMKQSGFLSERVMRISRAQRPESGI